MYSIEFKLRLRKDHQTTVLQSGIFARNLKHINITNFFVVVQWSIYIYNDYFFYYKSLILLKLIFSYQSRKH